MAIARPLVLVGQAAVEAEFVSASESGKLTFRVDDEVRVTSLEQLVCWSTAETNYERSEIMLIDGSRIVLADSWTGSPSWQLDERFVTVTTIGFGKISVPRQIVRAILTNAPSGLVPRTKYIDRLIPAAGSSAGLLLTNEDRWDGQKIISAGKRNGKHYVAVSSTSEMRRLEAAVDQLAAIVLQATSKIDATPGMMWIGTRDGSLLNGLSFGSEADRLRVKLACGLEMVGKGSEEVVSLRSLVAPIEYLSDREDARYRHEPYMDVSWPFERDRNVLGGLLVAAGRVYAKGLGVTTATRLSFALGKSNKGKKYQRFVTSVALDAAAGKRGSVVFRVYLQSDGVWAEAYESEVMCGGDPPAQVVVELGEATQLALIADFADRGDELDYANWLNARLE